MYLRIDKYICVVGSADGEISDLDLVPIRSVATWRSYVNVVQTLGRSSGGAIGGFLAQSLGWRWSVKAHLRRSTSPFALTNINETGHFLVRRL